MGGMIASTVDEPVVDEFVCNGCGRPSEPTEEHFYHRDVGRLILAEPDLGRGEVRPRLEGGRYGEFVYARGPDRPLERVNFNAPLKNLLCKTCNDRAGKMEQKAARALRAFLDEDAVADYLLLRRWAWYFAVKLWWYKRPTDELRTGVLFPILSHLLDDGARVCLRVRVGNLVADPELWSYLWIAESDGAFFKYAMWATRGLVWIVTPTSLLQPVPEPVSSVPFVELMDVWRSNLPRVRRRSLVALPAVAKVVEDGRIGGLITSRSPSHHA